MIPRFTYVPLSGDAEHDHAAIMSTARRPGGVTAMNRRRAALDDELMHDVHSTGPHGGGFTVHPTQHSAPVSGYLASMHPELGGVGHVHDFDALRPHHLAQHRAAARPAFAANPDVHQGAWVDRQQNKVYLDTSLVHPDEGTVRHFALHHKQLAYYHLDSGHETYFDPTRDEDYRNGKQEAIEKYAEVGRKFGKVTPDEYHSYAHEYDPHPDAQFKQASADRAVVRARTRLRYVNTR